MKLLRNGDVFRFDALVITEPFSKPKPYRQRDAGPTGLLAIPCDARVHALPRSADTEAMKRGDSSAPGRGWRKSIERLEARILYSNPTATLDPQQATPAAGAQNYTFTVDYTDTSAIQLATLGNDDVIVSGPNFNQPGHFVSQSAISGGVQVNYSLGFPAGGLTDVNNGTYVVSQNGYNARSGAGVANVLGTGFPAGTIGSFNINLAPAHADPVDQPGLHTGQLRDRQCGQFPRDGYQHR